jgi:signal peptidase II
MTTFGWIAAATLVLDQLSKWAVIRTFVPDASFLRPASFLTDATFQVTRVLIPNFLDFRFVTNTGAAFSRLEGHTEMLTAVSIIISMVVIVWAWRLKPSEQGFRLSFGLILGGAIGNLIDRVRMGHVIDFIDAHWREVYHWPTFNLADSAICVGIALLFIAGFMPGPHPAKASKAIETAPVEKARAPKS